MRRATYASVATAGTLIVVKTGAWLVTDSVSLLSTLVDSLLDAAASVVNMLAVRQALVPPDREHRFGHGKLEPLAALGQSAFIAGSALFLVISAGQRFIAPRPVQETGIGIAVMLVSILATLALVTYQRSVVRRTGSLAIQSDRLHYVGDILVNAAVIVALVLWWELRWTWVDPVFAILISGYILFTATRIAGGAMDMLMDRELPESERQRIVDIVRQHPQVIGIHDLRTRAAGPQSFIQLHLEMDGRMMLYQANVVADTVEIELRNAFPDAEVIVHQDPYGVDDDSTPIR
ncbi:cation diffusion facilitator family transporter [Ferruginivarius sediminum]|uniref:Cation-efflux pump FieF n=2 Tax=Ferruginivarius sediminum TaxID=2661937 RepID=A0A369TB97_9PROT|nr:cation diffusion facilitator family transporter [Ferruginivarius sediminum]